MALSVCPSEIVSAPAERVWELLMDPAGYGSFFKIEIERVEPEGPAAAGQRFTGWPRGPGGRHWRIEGRIEEVDSARHQILFRTTLPLGVIGSNRIGCQAIDQRRCLLRFG